MHFLAKGGSLKKMIAEIYGKNRLSGGKGGSMHLKVILILILWDLQQLLEIPFL